MSMVSSRTRTREVGSSAGLLPAVNETVSPSPSSPSARYPVSGNGNGNGRRSAFVKHGTVPLQQQQQHPPHRRRRVAIETPPRSLGDDLESTVTMATSMATTTAVAVSASPPRSSSSTRAVSPKLSPISHASSTTRQQEQRHRQKDLREPPSPFQVDETKTSSSSSSSPSNNDSRTVSSRSQAEPRPRRQPQTSFATHDGTASTSNDVTEPDDFVDLTDLFVMLQRRDWQNVYLFLIDHPNSCRQTIHSKKGTAPLLHIVLRHAPPLPVLNLLLSQESVIGGGGGGTGGSSPDDVWKRTDTSGRFPLHVACSCGPDASLDVVSRLITADPEALRNRSRDEHGRFPLHSAVVTNASEDVVMELMIHYPDASFVPDSHGKIPIEYARDSCHGHNRLVVALEWAPMFLAASQAACRRISEDTENKLNSLREAHAAYEEQLEDRYGGEKMALVGEQIRCSDELAVEKERNIALAEAVLGMTTAEQDLIRERDRLRSKLDRERQIRKRITKARDEELKQILLGVMEDKDIRKGNEEKGGEEEEEAAAGDKREEAGGGAGGSGAAASEGVDASPSEASLPTLLKRVSQGYGSSKRRNEMYKNHLDRQRATNRKLGVALAQKETELRQARRNSHRDETAMQAAVDRAEGLALQHETALAKLSEAREEVERLRRLGAERDRKLAHSERRLRIQGKRLSGINDLIDSLKAAKVSNANRLDRIIEEDGALKGGRRSSDEPAARPSTAPKAADLSVDLSVEIEMAAMAAAHLDDCSSASSANTTPSARRREADLSAELAARVAPDQARFGGDPSTPEPTGSSANRQVVGYPTGTRWDADKMANRMESTPMTLSSNTVTTASFGDYGFDDPSVADRGATETPPVPQHVTSRCRREYDRCSPLSTPKLSFMRDS